MAIAMPTAMTPPSDALKSHATGECGVVKRSPDVGSERR